MSDTTEIQWTDSTWNIVTGCTRVSPGCARCYIERTAPFRMNGRRFAMVAGGESSTGVTLHRDRLLKVPRGPKVFTPSLGDLFHEDVPDLFIAEAFDVMRLHPDRVFQVLTKRPERARQWFAEYATAFQRFTSSAWPLPNVWMGVSIENARYTCRADVLREIPAAVRFISAEPLLGSLYPQDPNQGTNRRAAPVGQSRTSGSSGRGAHGPNVGRVSEEESPDREHDPGDTVGRRSRSSAPLDLTGIDWVIVGGESGPKARPFHLEHAREIVAFAALYALDDPTAVFVKQLGAKPLGRTMALTAHNASTVTGRWAEAPLKLRDRKGGDWDEWPADLRIREFPRSAA